MLLNKEQIRLIGVSFFGTITILGLQFVQCLESVSTDSQDSIRSNDYRLHSSNNNNDKESNVENIIQQQQQLHSLPLRGTVSSISSVFSIWIRLIQGIDVDDDDDVDENGESSTSSLVFGWWIVVSVILSLLLAIIISLVLGKQWYTTKRQNQNLSNELETALAKLRYLQEKLHCDDDDHNDDTTNERSGTHFVVIKAGSDSYKQQKPKEIRIFMDGAFDLLHFGHMNAFRLARSLGTHLVVGVNSDESITQCKGPPLLNDEQRLVMVSSCKFVDDVVPNCPYIMNADYLDWVIKTYDIDYVVHGDDPCFVDGVDVYAAAKASGKFRTIPRTSGVSTTDIVGRMLVLTKEHHYHIEEDEDDNNNKNAKDDDDENDTIDNDTENVIGSTKEAQNTSSDVMALISSPTTPLLPPPSSTIKRRRRANSTSSTSSGHRLSNNTNNTTAIDRITQQQSPTPKIQSRFLTTSRMLQLFSADVKAPTSNMKIIYIDGSWDLFHHGHVRILQTAREVCTFFSFPTMKVLSDEMF